MDSIRLWTVFATIAAFASLVSADQNGEKQIQQEILANYWTKVRPVARPNDTLDVNFGFTLNNIVKFDLSNFILTVHGWLSMTWQDAFIQWNPADVQGVQSTRISPRDIWTPDIRGYNTISEAIEDVQMVVDSNGLVMHVPPTTMKAQCSANATNSYDCSFKLGSWTYDGNLVNLQVDDSSNGLDISNFLSHPRWNVTYIAAKRYEVYYDCCPEPYIDWRLNITITDSRYAR